VQPQASAACAEVPHGGLLVCHAQATGPEPGAQEALGCDGFGVGGPEDHAVSGVPHSRVGPTAHACRGLGPALPRCGYFLVTLCLSQGEEVL
jgi:hypothetical protein